MGRAALLALLIGAAACAAPVPPETEAGRRARIYGTPADPNDGAKYVLTGNNALKVTYPPRELPPPITSGVQPTPEQLALWKWKPTPANGVRLGRGVRGDFTASVRVTFALRQGPLEIPRGQRFLPAGVGLFAWSGDGDHVGVVRCEAAAGIPGKNAIVVREEFQTVFTHALGVRTATGELPNTTDSAYVRLTRKGAVVRGAYSRDGAAWTELPPDEVDWKEVVTVGVYAAHALEEPFDVTFDEYAVTVPVK